MKMRLPRSRLMMAASLFAGLWFATSAANAQVPGSTVASLSDAQLRIESDSLFKQILINPKNLDASFRYAEVSTRLGDYEAAIGALERILFYEQNLPRVELELGLLYFRLGSYEMAKSHFTRAQDLGAPADVGQKIDSFLKEIEKRMNPSQLSVFGQIGLRYQSNANAGPSNAVVRALGFDATLSSEFLKRPDWNAFGLAVIRHSYDFENDRGDTWESNLTTYYARQFRFTRLNVGLAEVDMGPRLTVPGMQGLTVRPYALGNIVTLGDNPYASSWGGGASVRYQAPWGQIETGIESRDRVYRNSSLYPTVSDQTGALTVGFVSASGFFENIPGLRWQGKLSTARATSKISAYSYRQYGVEFALPYEFSGALAINGKTWTIAPLFGFFETRYDQPNGLVDPTLKRHDYEWRVGAAFDVAVYQNIGFAAQVLYMRTVSNLPNYATQNWVVSAGPTIRF